LVVAPKYDTFTDISHRSDFYTCTIEVINNDPLSGSANCVVKHSTRWCICAGVDASTEAILYKYATEACP